MKVDGEPRHWDLMECLKQYFGSTHAPERKNLEFLIGLRNKIEHRNLPELDAALYGECQAALLNFEEFMVQEFGRKYALTDQLAVSLQFSRTVSDGRLEATRVAATQSAKAVKEYVEGFRGKLSGRVLNSMKYSFTVYLVPRVANRGALADAAVQFVKVDEAKPGELERLERLNVLIREKQVPILNLRGLKPSEVVREVNARIKHKIDLHAHTCAWRHLTARPPKGDKHPERTRSQFCVYDETHEDYVYTKAWVDKLVRELGDRASYERIVGRPPLASNPS